MISVDKLNWFRRFLDESRAESTIVEIQRSMPWKWHEQVDAVTKFGYPDPRSEYEATYWKVFSEYSGVRLPQGYGYRRAATASS